MTVMANGPFMSYSSGVMTSQDCPYSAGQLDHAVAAIGWKQMDGQDVLIVRNSWGTRWGSSGYIYMAMDGGNNGMGPCGILEYPSSATVASM
jgi:C1A family cysteine protease